MTELALFASAFFLVFLLGLQSLNVNGGHYVAAALTSLGLGTLQVLIIKLVPGASLSEMAATIAGGPFGITASMYFHRRTIGRPVPTPNQGAVT